MEWISVKDRLPDLIDEKDYSKNVIGLYRNGRSIAIFNRYYDSDGWCWCRANYLGWDIRDSECEFDDDYDVTHWIPIPNPPIEN